MDAPLENPVVLSKGFKMERGPAILLSISPSSFNAWLEWKLDLGKLLDTSKKGIYIVVFRYLVESVGLKAAKEAVSLFEAVAEGKNFDINKVVSDLKILREDDMLGPTTWSIVKEAKSRDIPFIRLNENSYIQLGYGAQSKKDSGFHHQSNFSHCRRNC